MTDAHRTDLDDPAGVVCHLNLDAATNVHYTRDRFLFASSPAVQEIQHKVIHAADSTRTTAMRRRGDAVQQVGPVSHASEFR